MSGRDSSTVSLGVLAGLALLLCCGGPLLLGALVAGGLGAGLLSQGALLAGLVVLGVGGMLGVRYLRSRRANSCAECENGATSDHAMHRST